MAQPEFCVKLIVEGKNTQTTVYANDAASAARLAREQYSGSNVRVLSTDKVKG